MNLGMSFNFGDIDLEHIAFPVHMRIDYIRVYQPSNEKNIGCDPENFPTAKYINQYVHLHLIVLYVSFSWCTSLCLLFEKIHRSLHQPQSDDMERRLWAAFPREFVPWTMLILSHSIPSPLVLHFLLVSVTRVFFSLHFIRMVIVTVSSSCNYILFSYTHTPASCSFVFFFLSYDVRVGV